MVPVLAWVPDRVVILAAETQSRASSQEGGGYLNISGYVPSSAMQQGQRRDGASVQQVMIHDLVYLQAIQGTMEVQTDIKSGSGCLIKLLFCCLLYGTSHSFAVLCDFILHESEDRKIFIVQGCQWGLSPFSDGNFT